MTNSDLIKACNLQKHKNQWEALRRAKSYWTALESNNYVKIERFREGWRIMPSDKHIQAYRAVSKAIKASR